MYLFYVDESGDPGDPSKAGATQNIVLAGAAIHEGQWAALAQKVDDLQTKYLPQLTEPVDVHCSEVRHGKGVLLGMQKDQREEFLEDFYQLVSSHPIGLTLFATVVHKPSLQPGEDPYERCLEDMTSRFDLFLRRQFAIGNPQKGLVVLDNTTLRARIAPLLGKWRRLGTRWAEIKNIIETTFFLDSRASRIVQIADFVASAVFQNYENGQAQYFSRIVRKLDRDPETAKIHGLRHITANRNCGCIACMQRIR